MTNPRIRKISKGVGLNNGVQVEQEGIVTDSSENCDGLTPTESLTLSEDNDDADETIHDCDTSTTFSLEECMNEFRARRIRRNSTQSRHKEGKERCAANCEDVADFDLIRQNLTNKEQERKRKPCKNGFCYCFTSDSGDGGISGKCQIMRQQRRNIKRSENALIKSSGNHTNDCHNNPVEAKSVKHFETRTTINRSVTKTINYPITAISCLETSKNNAPLIHITQELRDNCVISKVRVNNEKIQNNGKCVKMNGTTMTSEKVKKAHFSNYAASVPLERKHKSSRKASLNPYTPTAPTLEKISELETPVSTGKDGDSQECVQHRHKHGGKLLQKRLSKTSINYKRHDVKKAPPKPPRSSISGGDRASSSTLTSTSSSVREAEHILDEFLAKKGFVANKRHIQQRSPKVNKQKEDKNKSIQNIQSSTKRPIRTYPSLAEMKRVMDTKGFPQYEKNLRTHNEMSEKNIFIGWAEPQIKEMLNYEASSDQKQFRSLGIQAETQKSPNEANMGWKCAPKVELDMVDGVVKRNLAKNIDHKGTPIKIHLFGTPTTKGNKLSPKSVWSEQWRNLSPWANKKTPNHKQTNPNESEVSVSRAFLRTSKNKVLRLVSPKKENKNRTNKQIRKEPLCRTIGIQTSTGNINEESTMRLPPATYSYHSPEETSANRPHTEKIKTDFNFNRFVHSPRQQKHNLGLNCVTSCKVPGITESNDYQLTEKTYRSYTNDLDQGVTLSKMGYILSNIRAKLEASDDHAMRTFQETEKHKGISLCLQKQNGIRQTHTDMPPSQIKTQQHHMWSNEPIYSEIEEDSMHILESPHYDNHTGVENNDNGNSSQALYAKVNKTKTLQCSVSKPMPRPQPTGLGTILHDSLKEHKQSTITRCNSLEMLEQTSEVSANIERSPHSVSLNNVRVMEHYTSPRRQIFFNKSDLSLQQSGIFRENLWQSELIVDGVSEEHRQTMKNNKSNKSYLSVIQPSPDDNQNATTLEVNDSIQTDSVSYEFPHDDTDGVYDISRDDAKASNNITLKGIEPPLLHNQSTPKKRRSRFITKDIHRACGSSNSVYQKRQSLLSKNYGQYASCDTPQQQTQSLNNINGNPSCCSRPESSTFLRCHQLKNILRKSFHRSRKFIRNEARRFSVSLSLSSTNGGRSEQTLPEAVTPQAVHTGRSTYSVQSSLYLEALFALDESAPVAEQLVKAVNICRNLPELKVSPEMVEAERLLLYSTLKFERQLVKFRPVPTSNQAIVRFFIDDIYLQIQPNKDYDLFFNYFYIITFECDGIIKSTQSVECEDGVAVFRDCGIEFIYHATVGQEQFMVRGNVFILRLRKVSTLALEPPKCMETCGSLTCQEIVSRFQLTDSFILTGQHFVPYEYVARESENMERLCIRASRSCIDLKDNIKLKARAELRLCKTKFSGFLNVQDPNALHSWNRRWCTLDGIHLGVWRDVNCVDESPLINLNLLNTFEGMNLPLTSAPPELCARPRSFCLPYEAVAKLADNNSRTVVFFSADSQNDLNLWITNLNNVLALFAEWLH